MSTEAFCPGSYSNDIISNLPDSIQSHILSFLPTVDAVATCLLSKKWKNIWTTISTLTFDDCLAPFDYQELPEGISKKVKFAKFVTGVLHFHGENSLVTFSLTCASISEPNDISSWVSVAIMKRVRELHLRILDHLSLVKLPECLFNCVTLEVINLEGRIMIKVPNVVYLPNLRSLKLFYVEYEDDGSARKLISGCTSLDYLDINTLMVESADRFDPSIITSSSLRFLSYEANDENVEFLSVFEEGDGIKPSNSARCCLCCKTLEELRLSEVIIKDTFCLPNLRVLKLYSVAFDSDVLASKLISSNPSLESLVMIDTYDILKLKISSSTLRYLTIQQSDDKFVLVLDAPALQRLNLGSFVLEGIHIKDLSSLIDATIYLTQDVHDKRYNKIMNNMFHGLCNVKILSLSGRSMRATFPEHQFPKFPKLAALRVEVGCFDCPLLQLFIKNSNTLEDLILISDKAGFEVTDNGRIILWKDPEIVPECLLSSFGRLSFYGFEGFENELAMVEYLLKNTRMMQRMTIEFFPTLDKDNKIDLLHKLLKFRRGSEECEMVVRSDASWSDLRRRWMRTFFVPILS